VTPRSLLAPALVVASIAAISAVASSRGVCVVRSGAACLVTGAAPAAPSPADARAADVRAAGAARAVAPSPAPSPAAGAAMTPGAMSAIPVDAIAWSGAGSIVALERGGRIEVHDLSKGGVVIAKLEGAAPILLRMGRFLLASGRVLHDLIERRAFPLPGTPVGEPRVSPDGGAVAIALESQGKVDVFLVDLHGDEPRLHQLTKRGGASPRWIPGGRLLYEAAREDGGFGLFYRSELGLDRERPFWDDPAPEPAPAAPPPPPAVQA